METTLLLWAAGGFLVCLCLLLPVLFWRLKQQVLELQSAHALEVGRLESAHQLKEHDLTTQVRRLEQQVRELNDEKGTQARTLVELREQLSESREARARAQQQVAEYDQLKADALAARNTLSDLKAENSKLKTELEQQQLRMGEQLSLLQEAKQSLTKEFENTANKIFDDKQQRFTLQSKEVLETSLNPLRQQLGDFRKRVDDVYSQEMADRNKLAGQITELAKQTQKISQDAINLTNALKGDSKAQGNWGEVVLERLLEESGLQKGREYETQVSLRSDAGNRRNPDVIVRLPENKDIIIDAKVSLLDYERYCSAETEAERAQHLRAHIQSMRAHISGLSFKDYENLEGIRTLDFVFIFVPIEAAFMLALQEEPALFRDAYDKHIILVSPTTLLATLRTVENIWRYEKQNRNAEKIAAQAGGLYDQFVLMLEAFDDVGKAIGRTQDAYDKARNRLKSGRGNLIKRVEDIRKLGAKTKKQLRGDLVNAALDEAEAVPALEASDPAAEAEDA
ncbi:DNA recombination protein RmuC [Simiduia sp. 21SJ11W-1]|nr:DNA recombination protein RmuC [Simiduia sp. 21SJ11W-1]UTA49657.1 DNA recombination protein RmuC [Simiduia sp. 21SJ11W-1]